MRYGKLVIPFAAMAVAMIATPRSASAGTVILEGSDAITFHGDASYAAQVWKALNGGTSLPIAVIEGSGHIALSSDGSGVTVDNFTSVAAAKAAAGGTLSGYAALYFSGDAGDNEGPEGDSAISVAGAATDVGTYLAGGGTIMLEDYTGGAAWDFAVHTGGAGNAHVAGAFGGAAEGPAAPCSDGETVTATGLANGFTEPTPLGCWEHQAYDESFFAPLGFNLSFFDAAPGFAAGTGPFSALLSSGKTLSAVPEPATMLLLGTGLVGAIRRRRATRK